MRIESGDHVWEGPELAGPDARVKLRRWAGLLAECGAVDEVKFGRVESALYRVMGHKYGENLRKDILKGWTVDGIPMEDASIDEADRLLEPWGVLLELLMRSGFFGSTPVLLMKAADEKKAKGTPDSE